MEPREGLQDPKPLVTALEVVRGLGGVQAEKGAHEGLVRGQEGHGVRTACCRVKSRMCSL